jgi:hypothetical protein
VSLSRRVTVGLDLLEHGDGDLGDLFLGGGKCQAGLIVFPQPVQGGSEVQPADHGVHRCGLECNY